jgi:hypothetical protein
MVVAVAAPPSVTVTPDPLAAGLMVPETLNVFAEGFPGEAEAFCFVESPWQPTMAISISNTVT